VFQTEPPNLDVIFLVIIEMTSWLKNSSDHVIVVHQHDLKTSNPTLLLACLLSMMFKEEFPDGAAQVLPYVREMGSFHPQTVLS